MRIKIIGLIQYGIAVVVQSLKYLVSFFEPIDNWTKFTKRKTKIYFRLFLVFHNFNDFNFGDPVSWNRKPLKLITIFFFVKIATIFLGF